MICFQEVIGFKSFLNVSEEVNHRYHQEGDGSDEKRKMGGEEAPADDVGCMDFVDCDT